MKNHWVMDYESSVNCFLGVFEHYKTDEIRVFTVGKLRNDLPAFLAFLTQNRKKDEWHISYNGINFDSQITQYIMVNANELLAMSGERAANMIYLRAQKCIEKGNRREFQEWSERKLSIKQIDVFRLNHWDSPAKRSSLKSIQVAMRWHNIQDMPIHHTVPILTIDQLKQIAAYSRNDVSSTKNIMKLCKNLINFRGTLTNTYKIPLFSASEPKIAKELFLLFLSNKMGANPYKLKKLRTWRRIIDFDEIILPYINFKGLPLFEDVLKKFRLISLNPENTRGAFKVTVKYRVVKSVYG